jgi:hypothetical protein
MSYLRVREQRRDAVLDGISQNLNYSELAESLGVRRGDIIGDVKAMRRHSDPDLLEAQRMAQTKVNDEKRPVSAGHEARFIQMTGMSIGEKTFQNMVHFYRAELLSILSSGDSDSAIRELPKSVRRTLKHNEILINRGSPEISQRALDELL